MTSRLLAFVWMKGVSTVQKSKTYFEQVSLEAVRKIVEEQSGREESAWQALTQNGEQELSPWMMSRSAASPREEATTSPGVMEFPEWQAPLQELILEFNPDQFHEKLRIVETAILERLQQLESQIDGHRERRALNDALSILRFIARDRLVGQSGGRRMG
jgi:hypothetical protein